MPGAPHSDTRAAGDRPAGSPSGGDTARGPGARATHSSDVHTGVGPLALARADGAWHDGSGARVWAGQSDGATVRRPQEARWARAEAGRVLPIRLR